jgi:YD repeat-containing protein
MKDNQTIAQFLNVKDFPFVIKDKNGNEIYYEDSYGYWSKHEYNDAGNEIYYENSDGFWTKHNYDDKGNLIYREDSKGYWHERKYDDKGNEIRYENSDGYWIKREYDDEGNEIYFESSDGTINDQRPKPMIELTLEDIAKMKGVDVSQIRIKE